MKKLLIFTDTTADQINGVTRCIDSLCEHLPASTEVVRISADDFVNIPFLGYKEIRLSLAFPRQIYKKIRKYQPDAIHIMTEWPVGLVAAAVCKKRNIPYTTTFHTKFPEYLHMRNRLVKEDYVHQYLHYIHDDAERIFVSNSGMSDYLMDNGYNAQIQVVPLGIDHSLFAPGSKKLFQSHNRPIVLFVGRIAVEKNIEDFLQISDTYHTVVVWDGPLRESLEEEYPDTEFLGIKKGVELADIYRSADVFVFPSKTDTLGLVNLEAMACGKPVVAYDMDITRGIIQDGVNGILVQEGWNLESGVERALHIASWAPVQTAKRYTWSHYASEFLKYQAHISPALWI